jgi:tryptophanyl-tRNA synthetase
LLRFSKTDNFYLYPHIKKHTMARVLTGVQATDVPHLGNVMGAMLPAVNMSNQAENEAFLFIADMHSLTAVHDADVLRTNTRMVASAWLALGFDIDKNVFYRQSRVPETCELTWYLSCFMPFSRLSNATSFKDKADTLSEVNTGLFTYPMLMAADILLYDTDIVPVGRDQKQHLEFTQEVARKINNKYGNAVENSVLLVPEAGINDQTVTVPGTDGRKMSKSYKNFIDVLSTTDKQLRKQCMSIVSDSKGLEEPKDPNHFMTDIYKLVASDAQVQEMQANLEAGGYGWGHAKQAIYEQLLAFFADARVKFEYYMNNDQDLEEKLQLGEEKARKVARATLDRVRGYIGF